MSKVWNAETLKAFLSNHNITVDVHGENAVNLTLHDHDDLHVAAVINDKYMTVEGVLFEVGDMDESNFINGLIMRKNKSYELSSFAIEPIKGREFYVILGQLSASTTEDNLLLELNTLAKNAYAFVENALEALEIFKTEKGEK